MPITLVTGLPGAGKSLYAVSRIQAAASSRPVYVYGVDGLKPGAGWEPLDHPDNWQDLPDGSLVIVDEVQKVWPSSRGGDPTPPMRALSEHRHRGFDFVLLTQHPTMTHSYVRKLVGEHRHHVRAFGAQASRVWTWQEAQDDPQSVSTRDRAQESLWTFPKSCFGLYQSATMHTVKRKLPTRFVLMAAGLLLAVALIPKAYSTITGFGDAEPEPEAAVPVERSSSGSAAFPSEFAERLPTADYANRFTPAVEGLPWTAPAYADLKPKGTPKIYCLSSAKNCTCVSEQGTRWLVQDGICRHIARFGVYDPFADGLADGQPQESKTAPAGRG